MEPQKIRFTSNDTYADFLTNQSLEAVLYGGAGSGKSHCVAAKLLARICYGEGERFLVVRKVAATLTNSCWQLLLSVAADAGMQIEINKSERRIKYPPTGSEIILMGLDDPEKVKSIAGITGVWIEEATELDEQDYDQLKLRVRGHIPTYKQFVITFNPIDESHWLKKRFFDNTPADCYVTKTTYKDNRFLDPQYVQTLEEYRLTNDYWYNVYCLGEWGNINRGGEFYKKWSNQLAMEGLLYDNNKPLHLSFDFNVNPHMTCTVWQLDGKHARQIDEVCLEDPRNTTPATCIELLNRYSNHRGGAFIYGDVNGKQQDTRKLEKDSNDYNIIMKELAIWRPTMRVPTSNPSVAMRGLWINAIFAANEGGISVLVDRKKCIKTIQDYYNVKQAPDGTKYKKKITHPVTKVSYEPHGHTSDANDYFLCEAFRADYDIFQRGGPKPKPIVGIRRTGSVRL